MTPEETSAKIQFLKALNKVQGTIEPAKKDSTNPHFHSRYASLSSVNETVMGPLAEGGFVLLSGGDDVNGKPYLRTTLYHVGGHCESFLYPLIEKSENPQHIASSITYARRYSICALLNLSVEDDDGNTATAAVGAKATRPAESQTQASTPSPADGVIEFIPIAVSAGRPAGKYTAYDIKAPDGKSYSTLKETESQIAIYAMTNKKAIRLAFKQNGKYLNAGKIVLAEPVEDIIEEVPF